MNLPATLTEQLVQQVAEVFVQEGFVDPGVPGTSLLLGPPIEQWRISETAGLSKGGINKVATLTPYYYHQVILQENETSSLLGSAQSKPDNGILELVGIGIVGPMDECIEKVFKRLRELPHTQDDDSDLRLIALSNPRLQGVWRVWPDGHGEIWIADSIENHLFLPLECISEYDFIKTLSMNHKARDSKYIRKVKT